MSYLKIEASECNGRTILTDCAFSSPLKIAHPFYRGDMTEVMMMSASAGLLEGDVYDIVLDIQERAALKFTGQSYSKIFRAKEYGVRQSVRISVHSDGTLIWIPPPVIPFAGSTFKSDTEVHLDKNSHFLLCDILSCGRTGMEERYAWNSYQSRTIIYVDSKPVFLDYQRLLQKEIDSGDIGFFEGYSHIGTIYIYGAEDVILPEEAKASKTKALEGICIRMLADSAEEITELLYKIQFIGGNISWHVF